MLELKPAVWPPRILSRAGSRCKTARGGNKPVVFAGENWRGCGWKGGAAQELGLREGEGGAVMRRQGKPLGACRGSGGTRDLILHLHDQLLPIRWNVVRPLKGTEVPIRVTTRMSLGNVMLGREASCQGHVGCDAFCVKRPEQANP